MTGNPKQKRTSVRVALLALGAWAVIGLFRTSAAQQAQNLIQGENARAGTSAWQLDDSADNQEIEGYANLTSVNRGGAISFYVNTHDSAYTIEVFRMGWYGALGGRRETAAVTLPGIAQTMPTPDPVTGMIECNWISQYTLTTANPSDSSDWVSGVYLAKLTGLDSGKSSWIIFVVRDDSRATDLLYQLPVTTFQAYNEWGGKSLYDFNSVNGIPAVKVSFNRPYAADRWNGAGDFFDYSYSLLQFLEQQGYDVSYATSIDTHTSPLLLTLHKGFLSVAHDEYWSWEMRQYITGARDAGLNLGFFGANDIYWQIRLEPSPITGDPSRTEVCYKDSWPMDPMAANPATYNLITNRWRDANASLPGLPEDAVIGQMYNEKEPMIADVVIGNTGSFIFNGSGVSPGGHLTNLVGYEADRLYFNAPVGTQQITHSPYIFSDGTLNFSDITFYQAASGAAVFATGSMQWNWGLAQGIQSRSFVNPAAQQITMNVLARLITPPTAPSAYIGLRGTATNSTSSASTQLALNAPAALAANDVMLAQIAVRGGSSTTITPPPGWNLVRLDNQAATIAQGVYSHVVVDPGSEPSSYSWSFSSSNNAAGAIIAYYGISTVAPVDASSGQGNTSSTSITAPSLVVPSGHTGDLLVALFSTATATGFSLPTPTLPRWSFGAGSGGVGAAASDLLLSTDGATGGEIATASNSAPNIGALIALAPLTPATPTPTPTAAASPLATPSAIPSASSPTPNNTPVPTATTVPTPSFAATATPTASSPTPTATATSAATLITWRATGTGSTSTVSTQLVVNVPVGVQPNDLMIAQIAMRGGTGTAITPPSGWSLVRRDNFSATIAQAVYSRLVPAAPSEPSSYTWNFSSTNDAAGGIAAYFGANGAAPVDASNGQGNSSATSITAPSLAVPGGNTQDRLLGLFAIANSSTVTVPAGSAARWSFHAIGGGIGVAASDLQLAASGATGNLVATAGTAANNVGALIALLPGQAASATPTASLTPTGTPTATQSPTPTPTDTPTATQSPTPTPTDTPTATQSPSPTPTDTPTATQSPTPTPTGTPTATQSPTPTPTDTPTAAQSPTPTDTPTATQSPTPTPTGTPTATQSPTPTATDTPTATQSPSPTPTDTPTATQSPTPTPTDTPTATQSPSPSPTDTPTATQSPTPTSTPTATPSPVVITPAPTPTLSPTLTNTPAPTSTSTATPSPTPTSKPITLRASQTASTTTISTQLAISVPTGVQTNDLLIAAIAVRGGSGLVITPPPGWTLIRRDNSTSSVAQAIYWHLVPAAPAEPSSYAWGFSNANDAAGGMLAYVGASTVAPVDASNGQGNASSTTITAPSATIPGGHGADLLIGLFSIANSSATTVPAGMVQRWSFHAIGGGLGVAASDQQLGGAGTTGSRTAAAATAAANTGALLALTPQ